jgi:hypothetical protein
MPDWFMGLLIVFVLPVALLISVFVIWFAWYMWVWSCLTLLCLFDIEWAREKIKKFR